VGGGPNNPGLWKDVIVGKDITLNPPTAQYPNGLGSVAKYVTYVQLPNTLPSTQSSVPVPAGWLRAFFSTAYTFDSPSPALNSIRCLGPNDPPTIAFVPPNGYGGIIAATGPNATDLAFGIWGQVAPRVNGPVNELVWGQTWTCGSPPSGTGLFDFDTVGMIGSANGPFNATNPACTIDPNPPNRMTCTFTKWLISGTQSTRV